MYAGCPLSARRSTHPAIIVVLALAVPGCWADASSRNDIERETSADRGDSIANENQTSGSQIRFLDQLTKGEIAAIYENGQEAGFATILEAMGGGVAVLDYDLDSRDDLCFAGGGTFSAGRDISGHPPCLFRNRGDWKFEAVTEPALLQFSRHYTHGVIAADYDSDGFPDILFTGYGGITLWRNQGDGTFQDVTSSSGLTESLWSCSAGWGDVNGDGTLDLYVAHYVDWSFKNDPRCFSPGRSDREVCPPRAFAPLPDRLYFGNGDGTFRDASEWSGLRKDGKGLGVLLCDLDSDGDLDIYVSNDTVENFLYENKGDGRLEDVSLISATAFNSQGNPDGSMGVDVLDYNLDGQFDLWVTNYETEDCALYENLGQLLFRHVSQQTGISSIGGSHVSWGTCCFDIDCDGDEDIFVSNGHVSRFPLNSAILQLPFVCENLQGKRFIAANAQSCEYLRTPRMGRGAAVGDFNDDGRLDLAISHIHTPAAVLKNDSNPSHHWLELELTGVQSPRDAIGAIVRVTTPGGSCLRQWKGGGSYASTNTRRLHFGLGAATTIDAIDIRWPSGRSQVLKAVAVDQRMHVIEAADQIAH
jgi:hypothetical protein